MKKKWQKHQASLGINCIIKYKHNQDKQTMLLKFEPNTIETERVIVDLIWNLKLNKFGH